MRILWVGNSPFVGSGYGEQANLFIPRLQAAGHDIAVLSNYGIAGTQMDIQGIHNYPADGEWGNKHLASAAANWQADLVIVLHDAWVMKPDEWGDDPPPVAIWAPVDHEPLPPLVRAILAHDRVRPIAMSQYGYGTMVAFKLTPQYVPHGIDTNLFRPQPELRATVRARLDVPDDAFVVGMVAANRGNPEVDRKSFDYSFQAFGRFCRDHDAYLYVHSQPKGAIDLEVLATVSGIPEGRIRFTPQEAWHLGIPRELVATLYQGFDVLLAPSMGEGFGIPILEAQASGVPVITSPHSAMRELGQNGWLVEGQARWDPLQTAYFFDPFVHSIHENLDLAYQARDDKDLRERVVEFAQAYDADRVTEEFWKPALDALTAPLTASEPDGGEPSRAERRRRQRAAQKNPAPGRGAAQPQEVKAR